MRSFCFVFLFLFTHERVNKFRNGVQSSFITRFTFLAVLYCCYTVFHGRGRLLVFTFYLLVCFRRWIGGRRALKTRARALVGGVSEGTQKKSVSRGIVRRNEVFYVIQKIKTNDEHLSSSRGAGGTTYTAVAKCEIAFARRIVDGFAYLNTAERP